MSLAQPDQRCRSLVTLSPTARRLILAADRAQFRGDAAKCIDLIDAFYASLENAALSYEATEFDVAGGVLGGQITFAIHALCNEAAAYEGVATG